MGFAFPRREKALGDIAEFKSLTFSIYLAHAKWACFCPNGGGDARTSESCDFDFLSHNDDVLRLLLDMGDGLHRFLTLPTSSTQVSDNSDHFFWRAFFGSI